MGQIKHIALPPINETLISYDGNPMMHTRRGDGKVYFVYWFTAKHLVDFYAVVEVTEERLREFLENKRPIRAMFMNPFLPYDLCDPIYVYCQYPWDDRKDIVAWAMLNRDEFIELLPDADVFLMEPKNECASAGGDSQEDVQKLPVSGSGSD